MVSLKRSLALLVWAWFILMYRTKVTEFFHFHHSIWHRFTNDKESLGKSAIKTYNFSKDMGLKGSCKKTIISTSKYEHSEFSLEI